MYTTLYNLKDLSKILGVTERTLLTYIKDGKLKAVKIGGRWIVTEENFKAFINGDTTQDSKKGGESD